MVERRGNHGGGQVAGTAGVNLDGGDIHGLDSQRIDLRGDITLNDGKFQPVASSLDRLDDHAGLAGAGGGHQVQHTDPVLRQPLAVVNGL